MESKSRSQILLVGADSDVESRLRAELGARHYSVTTVGRGDEGLHQAIELGVDVVVSEINIPGLSGLQLFNRLHFFKPRLPVILIADAASKGTVSDATRVGVFRFLSKPFDFLELLEFIRKAALSTQAVFSALDHGEAEFDRTGLIGTSRFMRQLYQQIRVAAGSSISALILGATGTGKELIARAIHQQSSRAKHPFIPVNCSALTTTLFESEVFGHERGAFTGARGSRGLFEQANHGTLFLDEIGDLCPDIQLKLLRFLQDRCIHRVGGQSEVPLDVRVVAATNRDLENAMKAGQFRQDLYYRLSGYPICAPHLEEHPEDIRDLVRHFLRKFQKESSIGALSIGQEAVEFFQMQSWPGNVRELENVVHRAVLEAQGQPITLAHAEAACKSRNQMAKGERRAGRDTPTDLLERAKRGEVKNVHARVIEQEERYLFMRAMSESKGNQSIVAQWLGITRATLRARLRRFGMLSKGEGPNRPKGGPQKIHLHISATGDGKAAS